MQTVDDLIQQVREQLEEFNTETASTSQLLNALNRGYRAANNITSRKLDEIMMTYVDVTSTGLDTFDMPSDIFAAKIKSIQVKRGELYYDLTKIKQKQSTQFLSRSSSVAPYYYFVYGTKYQIIPKPAAGTVLRVWYVKRPDKLVLSQGRINSTPGANYVLVDTLGSDLTTSVTSLNAYVNFIDFVTGRVKGSAQIVSINTATKQVTFKTSGLTRTTVLTRTIATSLPTDLAVDDYVCTVHGSCVTQLPEEYVDYVIQFTVLELKRRFGEPAPEEIQALADQAAELKKMWAGRENMMRVRPVNTKLNPGISSTSRRILNSN